MEAVVAWARSRGYFVLLGDNDTYDVDPIVTLTAAEFLRWVNYHRVTSGLEPFPMTVRPRRTGAAATTPAGSTSW